MWKYVRRMKRHGAVDKVLQVVYLSSSSCFLSLENPIGDTPRQSLTANIFKISMIYFITSLNKLLRLDKARTVA